MKAADSRRRDLAFIHLAKKSLGLDDGAYRDMLFTLTRKRSSSELDDAERQRVKDHLRSLGFERAPGAARPTDRADHGKKPSVTADRQPLIDKLEALLADGAKPWNYVRAIALRRFQQQLEWCGPDQLRRLVAMLEYDKRRRQAKEKR